MEADWEAPETWLCVLESDGTTHIDAADMGALDAAVSRYVDSGCTRDEVLCLTLVEGGTYHVKASRINSWWLCTPTQRYRDLVRQSRRRDAERNDRAALGLPWKEDE